VKILYASNNSIGSYLIQDRFVKNLQHNYIIKTSAYRNNISNFSADWNLECLLNFSKPDSEEISFENFNYYFYYEEIKKFNPDLIISDLEIYTSVIALELNIKLWQVSPLLLYFGQNKSIKKELDIYNKHNYLINKNLNKKKFLQNIINNSEKKFIYSFVADSDLNLEFEFEFVRPDFLLEEDKKFNPQFTATTVDIADFFYNQKDIETKNCGKDIESILNRTILQKFNPSFVLNNNVKFLSQHLENLKY
jgi:hypothetical protein